MTAIRVGIWLAGACLIGWMAVQIERVFFFSASYDGLTLAGVAVALGVLTVATVVRFPRLWAAPGLLGLGWLVPYLAVIPTLSTSARTLADATAWALPGLTVLTLLGSQAGRAPWRQAAALAIAGSALAILARLTLVDPFLEVECWSVCLPNPFLLGSAPGVADGLFGIAALLVLAGLVESVRRPWGRTRLDRVAEGAAAFCVLGLLLISVSDPQPGRAARSGPVAVATLAALSMAGALLAREARERAMRRRLTDLAVELTGAALPPAGGPAPQSVGSNLATLLHDPSMTVTYWAAEREHFVDATGSPCPDPPFGDPDRCTPVSRRGHLFAVVSHSRSTSADRVAKALVPAMNPTLQNEQLRALSLAELGELESSRHRILERAVEERRRLERNLHDGAQQGVVSLLLLLRLLASRLPADRALPVERAASHTHGLLQELRRIARGIHPTVVAAAGLASALTDLADTSEWPAVTVGGRPMPRLSPVAEATAYEVVSTTLADAQTGSATRFEVRSTSLEDRLILELDHDSPTSSPPIALARQVPFVEALSGRLDVDGRPRCWHVRLEVPCVS